METHPSDLGASLDATLSRSRVRRRRLRTAVIAALAFAAGGLTVGVVPLVLTGKKAPPAVSSTILVKPRKYWLTTGPSPEEARREFAQYKKMQESFLKSRSVLFPAVGSSKVQGIESLKRHEDPASWVREHLQVDSPEDSGFITVSIYGASPNEQALLVNEVTASYLAFDREYSEGLHQGELKQAEKVYLKCRETLAAKRKSLFETEKKGDGVEASALRDEIAVEEELVKRLLTAMREAKLQIEYPQQVQLIDQASVPEPK